MVQLLLNAGADPYKKTEGRTPLDAFELADRNKNQKIIKMLYDFKKQSKNQMYGEL